MLSFQEVGQKRKMVIKIDFTSQLSHSPDCKICPFKKSFKKCPSKNENFVTSYELFNLAIVIVADKILSTVRLYVNIKTTKLRPWLLYFEICCSKVIVNFHLGVGDLDDINDFL